MAAFIVWTCLFIIAASIALTVERLIILIKWIRKRIYNKTHYKRLSYYKRFK